jgi:2-iminobutanoate/2-iminopropanoate deaminase
MKKVRVRSEQVAEAPPGLWSNCLAVGPLLFIAGLTCRTPGEDVVRDKDMYRQTKTIFEKMRHLVRAAGGGMDDIVKLTIFVTDISKKEEVWRARKEFFTGDFPTCSLIEVKGLASPQLLVEIEGVAYLGSAPTAAE